MRVDEVASVFAPRHPLDLRRRVERFVFRRAARYVVASLRRYLATVPDPEYRDTISKLVAGIEEPALLLALIRRECGRDLEEVDLALLGEIDLVVAERRLSLNQVVGREAARGDLLPVLRGLVRAPGGGRGRVALRAAVRRVQALGRAVLHHRGEVRARTAGRARGLQLTGVI